MGRTIAWITTLAVPAFLAQPRAAGPQAPQQLPTFRSGVDIVRLDVSVLDKDRRPVKGLTAGDFSVTVDGTVQPIVSFDEVVLPPPVPPTAAWMRDVAPDVKTNALGEPRLFVILMDDATAPPDAYMVATAKNIARSIVDNLLPSDLAAIVFSKDNRGAQDFTSDRALLLAAIDTFHFGWIPEMGPLALQYSHETLRRAVSFLRQRPNGRNAVMLIGVGGGIEDEADAVNVASDTAGIVANNADELARERREMRIALRAGLTDLVHEASIARIPIYGFSTAGLMTDQPTLRSPAPGVHQLPRFSPRSALLGGDSLRSLAEVSGGRAIVNSNDPAAAVPAIFEENNAYYLLGYRATYPRSDGRTRRLQIRVNKAGATVYPSDRLLLSAKPPSGKEVSKPPSPLLRAIAELVPKSDLRLGVTAAPFAFPRTADPRAAKAGVLASLRVQRPAPAERSTEEIEVLAKVFTPEGKEIGGVRQHATLILRPSTADAELDVLVPVGLAPGRYNIRYSAHSRALDRTGSVYTDVTLPDFSKAPLSLSGIAITADPMPSAAPRDAFAKIIPVVPTTRREFGRDDRVSAFMRVYQGERQRTAAVDVTARVTDADGVERASVVRALAAEAFGTSRAADYSYVLPLESLPAGSYLLTIEATRGSTTARRDVPFTVR